MRIKPLELGRLFQQHACSDTRSARLLQSGQLPAVDRDSGRLDRWGRSLADLVVTLKELAELGVGFVSLTEALDLTTPTGRAMAGLLSVFAEVEQQNLR